ncbi:MAG TPA: hypothetical protein VI933_04985 [archaeon]|nr:hypothetical protein [archaeon]
MRKLFALSLLACFIFFSIIAFSETNMGDESKSKMISDNPTEQARANAEQQAAAAQESEMRAKGEEVKKNCMEDPENCNCASLGDERAVTECDKNFKEAKNQGNEFQSACFKDPEACDCAKVSNAKMKSKCESEKKKFNDRANAIVLSCADDPAKCDCSKMGEPQAVARCEKEVNIGKEVKAECETDLDKCDCSKIDNEIARASCNNAKNYAVGWKDKFKKQCEDDPMNCDCSTVPNAAGVSECVKQKEIAIKQSQGEIGKQLDACFSDVDKCDCSKLPKPEYVKFCSEQLDIGKTCRDTGQLCDRLENYDISPPGLPEFLKPFFKSSIRAKVDAEKNKALAQASDVARECVMDVKNCKCESIPQAYRDFCIERRTLQTECQYDKKVESCEKLDQMTEVVPSTAPAFIKIPLDALLRPLINLQKEQIKGQYAEEARKQIVGCITNVDTCDCSKVPMRYRDFCQGKVDKTKKCYAGDYGTCFKLMDEKNVPEDIPSFIRIFVEAPADAAVKAQSEMMYMKMRHGKCEKISLAECKNLWAKGGLKGESKTTQ